VIAGAWTDAERSGARFVRCSVLVVVVALGCGGSRSDDRSAGPADSVAATSPSATDTATAETPRSTPTGTECPLYGDWQPCNLEDRLTRAGLVFERDEEPVRHDFLGVPGTKYTMHNAELQVFLYPNAEARKRDTDPLDTTAVAPPGKRVIWPQPPTLVVTNNLAAIVLTLNGRLGERIALAIGAGLPAAPRDRAR
jgi:hypothetical protein